MKRLIFSLLTISLILACSACSKTKAVNILSDSKMNVGQRMSCIFAADNLYCSSSGDIEQIEKMKLTDSVVFDVRGVEKHRSDVEKGGEAGTYPTSFSETPQDYSFWHCNKTGKADPAVTCKLLKNTDQNQLAAQLELAKFQDTVVRATTEKRLMSTCGAPRNVKSDNISKTLVYPTSHPGILAEVRFDTYATHGSEPKVDFISTVHEQTGELYVQGILWYPYSEERGRVESIREYLPCLK